ncbi:tail fiber protein [Pseudobacillus wudalianchiensis]|uniref:Tail fiber protein n=1 Tax=Pseudobacillus wudalianchiensis TaxID=1743143 RepID=A0A1B9AU11_9BACI|nr:phage tail protein [Bacillus wudalianchiensis]OCA87279.1 hypothetical protein A8F95_08505 [Bacillus wudalianchiensis]
MQYTTKLKLPRPEETDTHNLANHQLLIDAIEANAASQTDVTSKYTKPALGIPKADLATAVQSSLNKADSALQSVPDATTAAKGVVQLNDSTASTSTTQAATANAVKKANDNANSRYTKPGSGIPKADLAADVQASLNKADASASNDALTSHLADYKTHTGYASATGTANAYIATLTPALSAYAEGVSLRLKINADNTGASTVNVNGLGAKPIKKANGTDVGSGNLKAGSVYTLVYNGVNFILQGEGSDLTDTDRQGMITEINKIIQM